jgi:hypothetical protein
MSAPIDDLTAARKRLVEERRQSAKSLAGPFEHGMTDESFNLFGSRRLSRR